MTLSYNATTPFLRAMTSLRPKSSKPGWAWTGLALSLACVALALTSGLGFRLGWWGFREGFQLLGWAAGAGLFGAFVCLGALLVNWNRHRAAMAGSAVGLVMGLLAVSIPLQWQQALQRHPRIHDISTDTDNPPGFVAAAHLRGPWEHGTAYHGEPLALKQKSAYPDIRPLHLPLPTTIAYTSALQVLQDMGMRITARSPAEGRIEAVATTPLYGFTDDVVVRVRPGPMGALVDARSMSRVGTHDLGKNAKRLRVFLHRLRIKSDI